MDFLSFDTSTFDDSNDLQWMEGNTNKIDLEALMNAVGIIPEEEVQNPLPVLNNLDIPVAPTVQNTNSTTVQNVQPPAVRVQNVQQPAVRVQSAQPPAVRIQNVQRPTVRIQNVQGPTVRIQNTQPTNVRVQNTQPPTVRILNIQHPTVRVQTQRQNQSVPVVHTAPKVQQGVKRPMMENPSVSRVTNKRPVYVMSARSVLNQIMPPQPKTKVMQSKVIQPQPDILRPEMFQVNIPDIGACYSSQPQVITNVSKKGKKCTGEPKRRSNKPSTGYLEMIARALLSVPGHRMLLTDIYTYIQQWYPYFQTAPSTWRNAVRHNLTVNDCFCKTGNSTSGRGYFWEIHPACVEMFRKGDFRRMQARRLAQQHYNTGSNTPSDASPPTPTTSVPSPVNQSAAQVPAASQPHYPSNNNYSTVQQQGQIDYNQGVAVPTSAYQQNYASQTTYQQQTMSHSTYQQSYSTKTFDLQQDSYSAATSSSGFPTPASYQQESNPFDAAIPDFCFDLDQMDADLSCPSSFDIQDILDDLEAKTSNFEPVTSVDDFLDEILSQS